jgi:hypothetical protein
MDRDVAQSLIRKLRAFTAETLDDGERALFARLLAPGLAAAYSAADDEVRGYALEPQWAASPLVDALLAELEPRPDLE